MSNCYCRDLGIQGFLAFVTVGYETENSFRQSSENRRFRKFLTVEGRFRWPIIFCMLIATTDIFILDQCLIIRLDEFLLADTEIGIARKECLYRRRSGILTLEGVSVRAAVKHD
jgi:hypothetical protein